MLVLTRKSGQALVLDQTVRVTVEIKGDRVKVAVAAPPAVRVLREELANGADDRRPETFLK